MDYHSTLIGNSNISFEVLNWLLINGVDPNYTDGVCMTPLAAHCESPEKLRLLISHGADPLKTFGSGFLPIELFIRKKNTTFNMKRDFEILQLLGFNKINCAKFFIRHGIQYDKVPNGFPKMTNAELIDTVQTILDYPSSLDWYQNILTEEAWNRCSMPEKYDIFCQTICSYNLEIVKYFVSISKMDINTKIKIQTMENSKIIEEYYHPIMLAALQGQLEHIRLFRSLGAKVPKDYSHLPFIHIEPIIEALT